MASLIVQMTGESVFNVNNSRDLLLLFTVKNMSIDVVTIEYYGQPFHF